MGFMSAMGRGAGRGGSHLRRNGVEYGLIGALGATAGLTGLHAARQTPDRVAQERSRDVLDVAEPGADFALNEAEIDAAIEAQFSYLSPEERAAVKRRIMAQQAMAQR